jgi:RNA polymerase sigma-70 factor (ECF subfamily)
MIDDKIRESLKRGDTSPFEALVQKYQDRIYNLCRYMLNNQDDAKDAAQDTFVKAFQNLKNFTPTSSLYTWLYRIAVNTCLDHKRKFSLHSLFFASDNVDHIACFPSHYPSPETEYAAKQSMQALRKALNCLSKKLRVVIVFKELEGLSYEEIAEVLDVSVGTVKSRISRARKELEKNMEKLTEQK